MHIYNITLQVHQLEVDGSGFILCSSVSHLLSRNRKSSLHEYFPAHVPVAILVLEVECGKQQPTQSSAEARISLPLFSLCCFPVVILLALDTNVLF